MFRTNVLLALLSVSAASAMDFRADSKVGRALLKKAKSAETDSRQLEQNWYQYNQNGENNQDGDRDSAFLAQWYIRYEGCASTVTYGQEDNGNDGNPLVTSNLVKFKLCESCSSCSNGGSYVVGMQEFVQAYNEMKMDELEYKCEMQQQACEYNGNNNNNNNNGQNYNGCNMDEECWENDNENGGDEQEFELEQYLECAGKSSSTTAATGLGGTAKIPAHLCGIFSFHNNRGRSQRQQQRQLQLQPEQLQPEQ